MRKSYFLGESIFSSGGVLYDSDTQKVCLIFKKTSGEWLLPKGRMEEGETLEENASREIYEETGYQNKIKKLLSIQIRPDLVDVTKEKVIFWFLSIKNSSKRKLKTQKNDENFTINWFVRDDAIKHLKWEDDKKLIVLAYEHE